MAIGSSGGGPKIQAQGVHGTASARRRVAIEALGREISSEPGSAAQRLGAMLATSRRMVVSGDIDGVVSAAMLGSVAKDWNIVAFSMQSNCWLVHPSLTDGGSKDLFSPEQGPKPVDDLFGVDLFSVQFDNV